MPVAVRASSLSSFVIRTCFGVAAVPLNPFADILVRFKSEQEFSVSPPTLSRALVCLGQCSFLCDSRPLQCRDPSENSFAFLEALSERSEPSGPSGLSEVSEALFPGLCANVDLDEVEPMYQYSLEWF